MTAIEFYHANLKDGRALLTQTVPQSFDSIQACPRPGRRWRLTRWLVRVGNRLVLCIDREPYPVARFVKDDAVVWTDMKGDYRVI